MAKRSSKKDQQGPRTDMASRRTRVIDEVDANDSNVPQQGGGASSGRQQMGGASAGSLGDGREGPSTRGTLSSGYSGRSSTGGTGGGVLQQRGSGYSPGAQSREGGHENEADPLASEGVAAGASGIAEDRHGKPGGEPAGASEKDDDYAKRPDGAAAVTGVSGVSGGGRGTTSSGNTRK